MTEKISSVDNSLISDGVPRRYPPSWPDRFNVWLAARAAPPWVFFGALWLLLLGIEHLIHVTAGASVVGELPVFHAVYTATVPYTLLALYYLDQAAGRALDGFRPALSCSDLEFSALRHRFTTMPNRPVLYAAGAGFLSCVILMIIMPLDFRMRLFRLVNTPASVVYNTILALSTFTGLGVMIYHTVRQLQQVNRIYVKYTSINLYQQRPLYALSGVAAASSVIWVIGSYAWYAAVPGLAEQPAAASVGVVLIGVAIAALLFPLNGIHRMLLAEKGRLLAECHQNMETVRNILHGQVESNDLSRMDDLNKALASLEIERNALLRAPTWPWQPETLRWVVAALLFPLIVWMMQRVLQQILAP